MPLIKLAPNGWNGVCAACFCLRSVAIPVNQTFIKWRQSVNFTVQTCTYPPPPPTHPPTHTHTHSLSPSLSIFFPLSHPLSRFFLSAMVPQAILACECGATFSHFARQGVERHMKMNNHRPPFTRRFAKQWPEFNPANENPALSEDKFSLVLNLGKQAVNNFGGVSLALFFWHLGFLFEA